MSGKSDAHRRAEGTADAPIVVGLVNNMPDAALESVEAQFRTLIDAAAGVRPVRLRFSSLPEVQRGPVASQHITDTYWRIDDLLGEPLDALIVTGTEPRAQSLRDEPYWPRLVEVLEWAQEHTLSSIWSCLAAHAAVLHLDGVERRRLPHKCCGVFEHMVVADHPLMDGIEAPLRMPQSRWNDLPTEALAAAGYNIICWSGESGAHAFVKHRGSSLLVFLQGHPEYDEWALLKEYRRDIGRFLGGQQAAYPDMPRGYLTLEAIDRLAAFQSEAMKARHVDILSTFPFTAVAECLTTSWRASAIRFYGNWLSLIEARRQPGKAREPGLGWYPAPAYASTSMELRDGAAH